MSDLMSFSLTCMNICFYVHVSPPQMFVQLQLNISVCDDLQESSASFIRSSSSSLSQPVSVCFICGFVDLSISD